MKKIWILFALLPILTMCTEKRHPVHHPSHAYIESMVTTDDLDTTSLCYVPIYSEIYHQDGSKAIALTATLSIRNTDVHDTLFILAVDYYNSMGQHIRSYLEHTLQVVPLESLEFIVEEKENEGGAGANFIVQYGSSLSLNAPVIQAVHIGTTGQQGLSFITESVGVSP